MFTKYEHSREYRVVILNKSQHICKIGVMLSKYLFKSIEDKFRKVKFYFYAMIHLFFFQKLIKPGVCTLRAHFPILRVAKFALWFYQI